MTTDVRTATMAELVDAARDIGREVELHFGELTAAQLNWKSTPDEWSIGQCFDHIITANTSYFADFDRILGGARKKSLWQRLPVLPDVFGRFLINAFHPDTMRKMQAPTAWRPTQSHIAPDIIARFLAQQATLIGYLERLEPLNVTDIMVTSPAASFVTYNLLNGCRIMVIHEQHHIHQIQQLLDWPQFPSG